MDRSNSDVLTREYYDSFVLIPRSINGVVPLTKCELFGQILETPIMAGAMGRYDNPDQQDKGGVNSALEFANVIKNTGTIMWTGFSRNDDFAAIVASGVKAIRVIKPLADHDRILQCIEHDERCGAIAFSMDIDHSFDRYGRIYEDHSGPMEPKSFKDLKRYVDSTKLPFIAKGVLSAQDAMECVNMGAGGIVVSHHQNIFPYSIPPLMVLPEIVKAVDGTIPIIVDCGIESGIDAFKALALGADAVCVARTLKKQYMTNGASGLMDKLQQMTGELAGCLARTGSSDIKHINPEVLRRI